MEHEEGRALFFNGRQQRAQTAFGRSTKNAGRQGRKSEIRNPNLEIRNKLQKNGVGKRAKPRPKNFFQPADNLGCCSKGRSDCNQHKEDDLGSTKYFGLVEFGPAGSQEISHKETKITKNEKEPRRGLASAGEDAVKGSGFSRKAKR